MRSALPVWEMTYAHDRRAHRHRCQCCRRIVEAGERVLMVQMDTKRTRVCHAEPCAEVIAVPADMCREEHDWTYRDLFIAWARATLKARGWSDKLIDRAEAMTAEAA